MPNFFENKSGGGSKIVYRRIPVYDTATSDLLSQADGIVGFISSGLHHGSVLVHCREGVSRSTTCVIFFLMRKLGMTYADAFEMCKRKRRGAQPIPAFVEQCQKYERKCRRLGVMKSGGGGGGSGGGSSTPKKRKLGRSIGPAIGPSIGPRPSAAAAAAKSGGNRHPEPRPTIGPVVGPAEVSDETKVVGAVVGPDIRPAISHFAAGDDEDIAQKEEMNDNRKRESSKKAKIIGPAPPPGTSRCE